MATSLDDFKQGLDRFMEDESTKGYGAAPYCAEEGALLISWSAERWTKRLLAIFHCRLIAINEWCGAVLLFTIRRAMREVWESPLTFLAESKSDIQPVALFFHMTSWIGKATEHEEYALLLAQWQCASEY